MYVDSHCHLDRLDLEPYGGSLPAAIEAARQRGVKRFLCIGINLENAPVVMAIARENDGVVASIGIHPGDVTGEDADWDLLGRLAQSTEVVAIGETGLDYYYGSETAELQRMYFSRHLELSAELGKPVIVHTREAREDTIEIISRYADAIPGGVLDCFTEDWPMAKRAIELGFYISFSGIITFANASSLREVASKIPIDRILIETDSPYLAPVPYRGKKNEPSYLVEVAQCLSEIKGLSLEDLAAITSNNFDRLFGSQHA